MIPRSRYPNLDNGLIKKGDKDPSVEELIPAFQKVYLEIDLKLL